MGVEDTVKFQDLDDEARKAAASILGDYDDVDPVAAQQEINKEQLVGAMAEKGQAMLDKMAARGAGEQVLALSMFKGMRGIPTKPGTHWHDSAGGDVVITGSTEEELGYGVSTTISQNARGDTLKIEIFPVQDGKKVEGKDSVFNFRPDNPEVVTEVGRDGGMTYPAIEHSVNDYNPDDPQAGDTTYPMVAQAFMTNAAQFLGETEL